MQAIEQVAVRCTVRIFVNFIDKWYWFFGINVESIYCFEFFGIEFACHLVLLVLVAAIASKLLWNDLLLIVNGVERELPPEQTSLLIEHVSSNTRPPRILYYYCAARNSF